VVFASGDARFATFTDNFPKYVFIIQSFWENVGKRSVPDLFGGCHDKR